MLEAGFSWLVPVVLNGFPVDWEQQVNAGLEALTQGDEEEGAGTQEHSSALLEAPAAGLMPAHEEGYEGGEHKASKEGEAANEEQQEREDTLPLASVIKDEEGGRGKPSGQAAPGRAEEAKSDGGASERQGNGSKRTRAVCPDRGRSSQAEDTPLKQLAQVSRTCRRGRAARRSAAGCAAELGGNTLPLGANVGMGEDAGGQGDDAGGGAGGPVEDDAGEKVEAPAPGHEAGAKESEMKVQRAGQDDPSSNAKGEEKSQAKHLAGASGKASTATKAQTKAPAAGRGGGQGQAAAAPGRPVLPRSSKASETFLPLKPLNASSSSSAPAAAVLTTRSGRVCIAPLDFWRGERLVRDPRDSTPMGITAPYLESAQAKPLCRAGQGVSPSVDSI